MKRSVLLLSVSLLVLSLPLDSMAAEPLKPFRPPAVPLVAVDPYFSIWSPADRLTDAPTCHWTGKRQALSSLVRIDGRTYRLMGSEPAQVPPLPQTALEVLPTRTICTFEAPEVRLTVTFLTPTLPEDLDLLSLPLTYLTWEVASLDGKDHGVTIYWDSSAELVVNSPEQMVSWSRVEAGDLAVLQMGSTEQRVLARKGDDLRIEWGYAYAGTPAEGLKGCVFAPGPLARERFAADGSLPQAAPGRMPRAASDDWPSMAFVFDLGTVGARAVSRRLILAYDDLYSIKYFSQRLRPYWRRKGHDAIALLKVGYREYPMIAAECAAFDEALMSDLVAAGGAKYARLAALAYRQCFAGNKLAADSNGQPLLFPKENFSNGCIATVDVIYPMAPLFLLFSSSLAKAMVEPILDYAASPRWKFPFAPHDLGTYPHATGQVYGGGERTEENQMPVEESGNMLILLAAIAKVDGNAAYAAKYWTVLSRWAEYLKEKGFDPENQLCTDDFAGHLAHNVNLSAKAILGLGSYAMLCDALGKKEEGAAYRKLAEGFVKKWMEAAADGDHYRLAFDKPGTWSQKYNLVWDRVLGLGLFPAEVARKELAYYRKIQNRYGLPLDNRKQYTKLDWIVWTATLTGSREDFEALIDPVHAFLNETKDRVPMTDWYETTTARKSGFQARPVVGAVFIPLLAQEGLWKKWREKARNVPGNWAPLPTPEQVIPIIKTARDGQVSWRYTFQKPVEGWFRTDFDDSKWQEGSAGFGSRGTPGAIVGTEWVTKEIWLRRQFDLTQEKADGLELFVHHDEDVTIYLNGVAAAEAGGYTAEYETLPIAPAALATLKPGKNMMAVRCRQTGGGQYIDVGIVRSGTASGAR